MCRYTDGNEKAMEEWKEAMVKYKAEKGGDNDLGPSSSDEDKPLGGASSSSKAKEAEDDGPDPFASDLSDMSD